MVCRSDTNMMRTTLLRPRPTTPSSDWRTQSLESPWLSGFENLTRLEVWVMLLTTATLQLLPMRTMRVRNLKCFIILNSKQIRTEEFPGFLSANVSSDSNILQINGRSRGAFYFKPRIIVPDEHYRSNGMDQLALLCIFYFLFLFSLYFSCTTVWLAGLTLNGQGQNTSSHMLTPWN